MKIQEQHYDVRLKWNRLDTSQNRDLPDEVIDWYLHEATYVHMERSYGMSNKEKSGFQIDQRYIDKLSPLVVYGGTTNQPVLQSPRNISGTDIWESDLSELSYDYWAGISITANVTDSVCGTKDILGIRIQTDDRERKLNDPYWKPSFKWGRVLIEDGRADSTVNGGRSIYTYVPSGNTLNSLKVDYIKHPERVWVGTYDLYDRLDTTANDPDSLAIYTVAANTTPVDCELPDREHRKINDEAVRLINIASQRGDLQELFQNKVLTNE